MNANSTGTSNSALGDTSGYDITTGTANTIIGYNTGRGITTGSYNTILGANVTGLSATIANNIIIADGQGNRRINVDSSGNVGIGTNSPNSKTHIVSDSKVIQLQPATSTNQFYIAFSNDNWVSNRSLIGLDNSAGNNLWATGGSAYALSIGTVDSRNIIFATNNNERVRIDTSGNVGIGTTTPSTKLEVVGTITCTTLVETSSVVAKTNVKKLTSQTAKIAKLSPVSFNYKKDNKRSLGLIAEEVAQVYPELVEYENGRPLGVNYSKLTSVLISAVNELAAELAELKKQLNK
jgi:hypothetical protein